MTRILTRNNRRVIRNSRLITTANGAPCCCGQAIRCECDPSLPIITNARIITCSGSGPPDVPVTLPPHRVETLQGRSTYTFESEIRTESSIGGFELVRTGTSIVGQEVWCRTARFTGNIQSAYQSFEYFYREPDQSGNYEYNEPINGVPSGRSGIVAGEFMLSRTSFGDCETVENTDQILAPNGFRRTSLRIIQQRTIAGGLYMLERTLSARIPTSGGAVIQTIEQRETNTVEYTRTLDLCNGSGGGTGDRPGGCNECGDPARLTLV